jgi:hypothetical protein
MKRPAVLAVLLASRLADEICRLHLEMFAARRIKALTTP